MEFKLENQQELREQLRLIKRKSRRRRIRLKKRISTLLFIVTLLNLFLAKFQWAQFLLLTLIEAGVGIGLFAFAFMLTNKKRPSKTKTSRHIHPQENLIENYSSYLDEWEAKNASMDGIDLDARHEWIHETGFAVNSENRQSKKARYDFLIGEEVHSSPKNASASDHEKETTQNQIIEKFKGALSYRSPFLNKTSKSAVPTRSNDTVSKTTASQGDVHQNRNKETIKEDDFTKFSNIESFDLSDKPFLFGLASLNEERKALKKQDAHVYPTESGNGVHDEKNLTEPYIDPFSPLESAKNRQEHTPSYNGSKTDNISQYAHIDPSSQAKTDRTSESSDSETNRTSESSDSQTNRTSESSDSETNRTSESSDSQTNRTSESSAMPNTGMTTSEKSSCKVISLADLAQKRVQLQFSEEPKLQSTIRTSSTVEKQNVPDTDAQTFQTLKSLESDKQPGSFASSQTYRPEYASESHTKTISFSPKEPSENISSTAYIPKSTDPVEEVIEEPLKNVAVAPVEEVIEEPLKDVVLAPAEEVIEDLVKEVVEFEFDRTEVTLENPSQNNETKENCETSASTTPSHEANVAQNTSNTSAVNTPDTDEPYSISELIYVPNQHKGLKNRSFSAIEQSKEILHAVPSGPPMQSKIIPSSNTATGPEPSTVNPYPTASIPSEKGTSHLPIYSRSFVGVTQNYEQPDIDLLQNIEIDQSTDSDDVYQQKATKLVETLNSFGVGSKIVQISKGPTVTRYELAPDKGVKVSKIVSLTDDIALNLEAASVRIEAPIPGKAAIGIEIPNEHITPVYIRELISSEKFKNSSSKLTFAVGKDISGEVVVADIAQMPHLLIAGATGSGKSVCINTLITSILYRATPSEVKFLMIDPKVVELNIYNGIPHLLSPVVTDPKKASAALTWAVSEMNNRYKLFAENNVRDLAGYNKILKEEGNPDILPQIVIIIDELADLMIISPKEVEDAICRLAQMARAAGMHIVIATQRPSVDVITGIIKANIPSRIAFSVTSGVDSRTILDLHGAEKLLGKGDMLFYPVGYAKPIRIQGSFISDGEVETLVKKIEAREPSIYDPELITQIDKDPEKDLFEKDVEDDLFYQAVEIVLEHDQASTSFLQRKLRIGYSRAGRIMDQLEAWGIISASDGSKARNILISKQEWSEILQ